MRSKYLIRPLSHGMDSSSPSLHLGATFSPLTKNCKIDQNSVTKRWGYTSDRDVSTEVKNIILYQQADGDRYSIYLTGTDACLKKTGAGETFAYITDTYTTGTVTGITGAVVTGNATSWATGVEAGDKFIMDSDHSANVEPDANWATVLTVDSGTQITLSASYTGGTTTGTYKIRRVYSTPSGERWSWAIVDDKLCFGNGNTNVQYWAGSGYAAALNSTYADGARYMAPYADRLVIADCKTSSVRDPNLLMWSKNLDPTDWTDTTAGTNNFIDTEDYIMGLGTTGSSLVVFKQNSVVLGERTGISTSPIAFTTTRAGVGCVAPYSIVSAGGRLCWLGHDDFYYLNGDSPSPIGEKMRYRFYDVVDPTEAKNTWGFVNTQENEIIWFANTSAGQVGFTYDYKTGEWYPYEFAATITAAGKGAI